MASHLIGISGRKRSGKDTFAERLISHHGFTRIAFADPLKATMKALDPVCYVADRDNFYRLTDILGPEDDWESAKELPEVRRLLQAHGVGIREHVDPDVWVNAAMNKVNEIDGPVCITDVRFPNEVQAVRQFLGGTIGTGLTHGKIVRINRPGLPETDLHISETALDDLVPDFLVRNSGTIDDLNGFADGVARTVLAGD